ncbi:unnamed protein product, partial [Ectocarpus sp. 4 AP-2014]
ASFFCHHRILQTRSREVIPNQTRNYNITCLKCIQQHRCCRSQTLLPTLHDRKAASSANVTTTVAPSPGTSLLYPSKWQQRLMPTDDTMIAKKTVMQKYLRYCTVMW